jgi:ribosomal protein L22
MMNISDIMVHINEMLDVDARKSLEETIRQVQGVIAPRFNPGKEHLLVISYNGSQTNPNTLLEKVLEQGYHAQLVGL